MNTKKQHIFWLIALVSVAIIAFYESYWLKGLYDSKKQALETQIGSLISKAELETYSFQLKQQNLSDSLAFLNPNKVASIKLESPEDGKIASIRIYKKEDFVKEVAESATIPDFLEVMDSVFMHRLNEAGVRDLRFALKQQNSTSGAVADTVNHSSCIEVKSMLGKGSYIFESTDIPKSVILSMWSIILTSLGVVAIVVVAFCFFIRSIKKQQELDEIKSSFTSNITHELKTPIAVAYAANDALLNYGLGDNPEKRHEYLRDIKDQLEKLSALVERILSMSMKERGNFRLDISEANIKDVLSKVAQETRLRTHKSCEIQIEADDELVGNFDVKLMSSVISTLVDNAVKYAGESVRIQLKAFSKDRHLLISVSDNGIGIDPVHQKHVFEKFYRVPHGDIHETKGYGIGLYFAKTIVERHGGNISLNSAPGKGSTFTIEL